MSAGGSVSKSSSKNQSTGEQSLGTLNPFTAVLGQALGIGTGVDKGGINFTSLPQFFGEGGIFGQEGQDAFSSLFSPVSGPEFNQDALAGGAIQGFNTLLEGSQTGFAPAINELAQTNLFQDTIPQLQESFGSQFGLNFGDSDFNRALAGAVNRSSQETAVSSIGNRLQSSLGLFDAAGAAGGLEQQFRDTARARTPGGQLLDMFMQLAGINQQGQSVAEQQATGSSKSFSTSSNVGLT